MKLYKIWQEENDNYDTYDSAIVVAKNEEDAKKIHPSGDGKEVTSVENGYSEWTTIENVFVKEIGEANAEYQEGMVICASYNAG